MLTDYRAYYTFTIKILVVLLFYQRQNKSLYVYRGKHLPTFDSSLRLGFVHVAIQLNANKHTRNIFFSGCWPRI